VTTIINDSTLAIYPAVATFYRDGSWLFCDAFAMSDLRMCVVSAIPAILRPVEQELTQLADLVRRGAQDGKQLDRQHAAVKAERPIHRSHRAGNAEASRTRSGGYLLEQEPGVWAHLPIPLEAEETEIWKFPISGILIQRDVGGILMPSRFTEQTVEELKRHRLRWAGQYQQPPKVIIRAQSLDEPMTSGSRGPTKHARSIAEFHIASLEEMRALLAYANSRYALAA
jgi:hypothetical protein